MKAVILASIFAWACCEVSASASTNLEYDGWIDVKLAHSLGPGEDFTDRGNITVRSVRSSEPVLRQNELAEAEMRTLKETARTDGFYRLRSVIRSSDGAERVFLSSVKADALLDSGLADSVAIWLLHDGSPASVEMSLSDGDRRDGARTFSTNVYIKHADHAPVPDTASYIQKMEKEKEARERGDVKDNRSFFAKYWMYILPIAMLVIISGSVNPEQQQGNAR